MSTKKSTVVVIDKKEYNLSGFEEEDYLQRVAAYINQKITEMNQQDSYKRIPQDMKNLMLNLNLADDYFKAKEQAGSAGSKFSDLEKEIFDLKHQLVDAQMQLDDANTKLAEVNSRMELVKAQNEQMQTLIEEAEKEKRELIQKNERLTADLEEVLLN
ncbi:MAG: cell division protein ZapA [Eubacterium sp.]|nr:cell division protein ZapA [Eubacterium sp.]